MPGLGGDADLRGPPEVGLDPVAFDAGFDLVEVLVSQADEHLGVSRPVGEPVFQAMRERTVAEATVTRAGSEATSFTLENDHLQAGLLLERVNGRPQSGEASTDDREVGGDVGNEWRVKRRRVVVVGPEHRRLRVGQSQRSPAISPHCQPA